MHRFKKHVFLIGALTVCFSFCILFTALSPIVVGTLLLEKSEKGLVHSDQKIKMAESYLIPSLTPWSNIGGCGAGGSGGGGGGGAKWIGRGVSGGLVDFQLQNSFAIGQSFQFYTFAPRFSIKPTYTTGLGISLPVLSKSGTFQPQSNIPDKQEVTGGLGDVAIDISKSIGSQGEYSLSIGLSIPTGQYDIKRGTDNDKQFLPASLQKGSGLYSTTFGLGYTKDLEDALLQFDFSYSHPFAFSLTGKNNKFTYSTEAMNSTDKSRFEYYFKPYGENALGGYSPPSLSFGAVYGNRTEEKHVYSVGVTFGCPLGVTWIPSYMSTNYDPIPDPDFQGWNASISGGMEFCDDKYPIFLGVSLPIHDKTNPPNSLDPAQRYDSKIVAAWDAPDWKDFGQSWVISFGIKATMF